MDYRTESVTVIIVISKNVSDVRGSACGYCKFNSNFSTIFTPCTDNGKFVLSKLHLPSFSLVYISRARLVTIERECFAML